jgi:hypothetical protein
LLIIKNIDFFKMKYLNLINTEKIIC